MKKKIRVLIVDDHYLVRIGLITSLRMVSDMALVGEASTGRQAIELYRKHLPDVIVMDLRLPDLSGIQVTQALRQEFPEAKVLMISTFDTEAEVYQSFEAGARGYVMKSVLGDDLIRAIRAVCAGERYIPAEIERRLCEHRAECDLTPREREVLPLLIKGLSNREIGQVLEISENTVKFHVKGILSKLESADRTEAATAALQRGLIQDSC